MQGELHVQHTYIYLGQRAYVTDASSNKQVISKKFISNVQVMSDIQSNAKQMPNNQSNVRQSKHCQTIKTMLDNQSIVRQSKKCQTIKAMSDNRSIVPQ
jgi:hypothetical protein